MASVLGQFYHQLHRAAIEENWNATLAVFNKCHHNNNSTTEAKKYALHFAIRTGKANRYFKFLLEHINIEDLKVVENGNTPISIAAAVGNVEVMRLLVAKYPQLPYEWTSVEQWPLDVAAIYGNAEMVSYLLGVSTTPESHPCRGQLGHLLQNLIKSELYGAALQILQQYSSNTRSTSNGYICSSLTLLANQPFAFKSTCSLGHFQRLLYYLHTTSPSTGIQVFICHAEHVFSSLKHWWYENITVFQNAMKPMKVPWNVIQNLVGRLMKEVEETKVINDQANELVKSLCQILKDENEHTNDNEFEAQFKEPFLLAAEHGIVEIVQQILDVCPSAIDFTQGEDNILVLAVKNRNDNILCLEEYRDKFIDMATNFIDKDGNNILHVAGKLPPKYKLNSIASPALQLKSEIQWFKKVRKLVPDTYSGNENNNKKTPIIIFQEQHKRLRVEGEKWMRNIGESCINMASLMIIVVFLSNKIVSRLDISDDDDHCHNILPEDGFSKVTVVGWTMTISLIVFFVLRAILRSIYYDGFRRTRLLRLLFVLGVLGVAIFGIIIAFLATLYDVVGNAFKISVILIFAGVIISALSAMISRLNVVVLQLLQIATHVI